MRPLLAATLGALLSGCSVLAAAAGADGQAVSDLAEADAVVIGALASGIAEGLTAGGSRGAAPPPDEHTFLCYLSPDGGEEVRADDAEAASAACLELHGGRRSRWRCQCRPLLAER